jgi:hypothetical protein
MMGKGVAVSATDLEYASDPDDPTGGPPGTLTVTARLAGGPYYADLSGGPEGNFVALVSADDPDQDYAYLYLREALFKGAEMPTPDWLRIRQGGVVVDIKTGAQLRRRKRPA